MILKALIVFVAMALTDALWALYVRRASEGHALEASLMAAMLVFGSGVVVLLYTESPVLLTFAGLGAFVGTYFTVRHDAK